VNFLRGAFPFLRRRETAPEHAQALATQIPADLVRILSSSSRDEGVLMVAFNGWLVSGDLATEMRERRLDGAGFDEVESGIDDPGIHELITTTLLVVQSKSRRLRQAWALTLRSEGRTLQEIADLFGVSHQRVSALLRRDASAGDGEGRR